MNSLTFAVIRLNAPADSDAFKPVTTRANSGGTCRTHFDTGVGMEVGVVGAPGAAGASIGIIANQAVVPADRPGALAIVAVGVDPVGAGERCATLPAVVAGGVRDETGSVAVVTAAVVEKKFASVAPGAVLTMLASAVFTDLAVGDGRVVLVRTLAPVVDWWVNHELARLARERHGAAALEEPDPRRREVNRTGRVALAVKQVPAVAADAAGVTVRCRFTVAPVAVLVQTPTT